MKSVRLLADDLQLASAEVSMAQASPSPNASGMLEAARLAARQLGQVVAAAEAYAALLARFGCER